MARPRKRPAPGSMPADAPVAGPPLPHAPGSDPAAASSADRERAADLLVQLAAARLRDTVDLESPEQAPLVEWLAAEARAALSPAERAELAREAEAFAGRVASAVLEDGARDARGWKGGG